MNGADLLWRIWPGWKFSESHHKPRLLFDAWEAEPDSWEPAVFHDALIEAYQGRNVNMGGDLDPRKWLRLFSAGPGSCPTAPRIPPHP